MNGRVYVFSTYGNGGEMPEIQWKVLHGQLRGLVLDVNRQKRTPNAARLEHARKPFARETVGGGEESLEAETKSGGAVARTLIKLSSDGVTAPKIVTWGHVEVGKTGPRVDHVAAANLSHERSHKRIRPIADGFSGGANPLYSGRRDVRVVPKGARRGAQGNAREAGYGLQAGRMRWGVGHA